MAKRTLTDAAIKRLKPPAKGQVDVFDRGYPGLALRVSYGGNRSWVVFYRHGGRLKRLRLGVYPALSLADARRHGERLGRTHRPVGTLPGFERPVLGPQISRG